MNQAGYTTRIALTVALGGFLMGFDASVISGVNKFIQIDFNLTDLQLGLSVSSLTIVAALAMMISGPLSDKLGRKTSTEILCVNFHRQRHRVCIRLGLYLFLTLPYAGRIGCWSLFDCCTHVYS